MFLTFSIFYSRILKTTLNLIGTLPSLCPICQLPQTGSLICKYCYSKLARTESGCFQCAEPLPESAFATPTTNQTVQAIYCGRCQKSPPSFNHVLALLTYQEPLSNLIQGYKFSHQLRLIPCLSDCLIQQIQLVRTNNYQMPDAIIPVPLHPRRLRQRGFNQSLLLAKRVSRHFQIPVLNNLVSRTKKTGEQAALNRKQRLSNMRDAFEVHLNANETLSKYNKVAIIDDVITSGSTCNELARILKQAGITIIDIWCVAKTPFIK